MKLLLVTADGGSQMIDYHAAPEHLRVPIRVHYTMGVADGPRLLAREYVLVDEMRSRAMREPLFIYEERLPGARPVYPRAEEEIPMCRDIRHAADPGYGTGGRIAFDRPDPIERPDDRADAIAAATLPPPDVYGRSPMQRLLEDVFAKPRRVTVRDANGVHPLAPPVAPPDQTEIARMPVPGEGRPVTQLELTMHLVDHPRTSKQDTAASILERFDVRHRD